MPEEHDKATELFHQITNHFEPLQAPDNDYKSTTLIRLMHEEVFVKDEFLTLFFTHIEHDRLGIAEDKAISLSESLSGLVGFQGWTAEEQYTLDQSLVRFARYLIDNFFLPLKSLAGKTPQPTPVSLSCVNLSAPAIGTSQRLSNLRQSCLQRDRYRCVITRKFDVEEGEKRYKTERENVKDDDGNSLLPEGNNMTYLEVAHIIPHSFMSLSDIEGGPNLTGRKQLAHMILKMFNPGAVHLISGTDIDRPTNAFSLTHDLHRLFGNFEIAFEPVQDSQYTYKLDYVKTRRIFRSHNLPVTRTLFITPDRSIEPPSRQLLEMHRAIAHILHHSAAGDYIDRLIRDMEDLQGAEVCPNGSTRLDEYVHFKIMSQFDGMIIC